MNFQRCLTRWPANAELSASLWWWSRISSAHETGWNSLETPEKHFKSNKFFETASWNVTFETLLFETLWHKLRVFQFKEGLHEIVHFWTILGWIWVDILNAQDSGRNVGIVSAGIAVIEFRYSLTKTRTVLPDWSSPFWSSCRNLEVDFKHVFTGKYLDFKASKWFLLWSSGCLGLPIARGPGEQEQHSSR